jgi:aspartyl-tRNA(Asn)/glutamyl-tRNA(Gln) amidotransferase subunit B
LMWDAAAGQTRVMRTKEDAHDYRYFPEPDLPPVDVTDAWIESVRATLPEMALAKKRRFMQDYGLPAYDAGILVQDRDLARFFEATCEELRIDGPGLAKKGIGPSKHAAIKSVSNWILTDILRIMNERKVGIGEVGLSPLQLASLVEVVADGTISNKTAKEIFPDILGSERTAHSIIEERGLKQVSDQGALREMVERVIAENPDNVRTYKGGKEKLFGFFVGQVLKASGGAANPNVVKELMKEALDAQPSE